MKALFFAVCLANVVFFFWELHSGVLSSRVLPPTGKPSLLLVSEREAARRGAEISAVLDRMVGEWQAQLPRDVLARLISGGGDHTKHHVKPVALESRKTKADRKKCYEVGPFADRAELQRWLLDNSVRSHAVIEKEVTVPLDFQVYYPVAKSPELLRINMMMLKAKGFTDIWPVIDGEVKGAISLGVFSDQQRASLFKAQLAARGVSADIRRRTKVKLATFVRIENKPLSSNQVAVSSCGVAPN